MALFPKTYKVKRKNPGHYINGKYIDSNALSITILADVQPMNNREIESLSIGQRQLGKIKIYTDTVLQISDEILKIKGDVVVYNNEEYEVISCDTHVNIMPHNKYIGELRKNDII